MRLPGLTYTSPYTFTRKQRFQLFVIPPVIVTALKAISITTRREIRNHDILENALREHKRVILAVWHETISLAAWQWCGTGYHTLVSYSFDGELASRVIGLFGFYAVRGSSSKGGAIALDELEKALDCIDVVGFTLDGPRGPRRESKPGVSILAARTGTPILPIALAAQHAWRLNSWDRFIVPKPFSKVVITYGDLIQPPADTSREAIETTRIEVERTLNHLHNALEDELGADPMMRSNDSSPPR